MAITTLLFSCSKGFLERPPLNEISENTFWKSKKDVSAALNGIYSSLISQDIIYEDASTDNAYAQYPWESYATELSSGNITTAVSGEWSFEDIRSCNYFLENVHRADNFVEKELLDRFIAEARYLRAFFYFNKINKYGDFPLLKNTVLLQDADVARSDRKDVLKFIIDELSEIAEILPERYLGGQYNEAGRITKGAALAILARIQLYEGNWKEAADLSQRVMQLGYRLHRSQDETAAEKLDDYATWIDFADDADERRFRLGLRSYESAFYQKNNGNSEITLDRQHIQQIDPQFLNTFLPSGELGGWSSVTPTQNLVDVYGIYQTGEQPSPISAQQRAYYYNNMDERFSKQFRNRDPRFYATIEFDGAPRNSIFPGYSYMWTPGASNMSQTGYNFRKLVDPDAFNQLVLNYSNVSLIRYAEILLTYAEAKNELSGPDQSIYAVLNEIRDRSGMPAVNVRKYSSQASLRELIRQERRIELALEGHRFMDIRRWGIAKDVMQNVYDLRNTLAQARTWSDKLFYLPVPQREIDLSKGVLTQNPGY